MKFINILLVTALLTTGCAMTGGKVDYDSVSSDKSADSAGQLEITAFDTERINFVFKNKSKSTAKIIWDESAIVDLSGNPKRVLHHGVKYDQAGQSMPPTIVLAGSFVSDFALPAENIQFIGGAAGWMENPMVPCSSSGSMCDVTPYLGKIITLVLNVEIDGKKHEYQTKIRVKKKDKSKKS